jgi:phosphatidylserine decarboxylase
VPGDLYSVNPATAACVPRLFARNERAVCVFESPHGPFVLVLVGATIVGSMATVWHGLIERRARGRIEDRSYADQSVTLRQGEEMGRFLLGSTVVLLFPRAFPDHSLAFNPDWLPQGSIRLGEMMAQAGPAA